MNTLAFKLDILEFAVAAISLEFHIELAGTLPTGKGTIIKRVFIAIVAVNGAGSLMPIGEYLARWTVPTNLRGTRRNPKISNK